MVNEPIKHHYIPRFILNNFSIKDNIVNYYDKQKGKFFKKDTKFVFKQNNLYRDEINYLNNPTQIEKDFSIYENEASKIIKEKLLHSKDISLTIEEDEKLKLFFALIGLRSKRNAEQFRVLKSSEYKEYQQDENYLDFWKRNLGRIVKCRSYKEVLENKEIDDPMKSFMQRDTFGYFGKYFVLLEKRGNTNFVLGDCYPVEVIGTLSDGFELEMFAIFPLSPDRVLLLASNGVNGTPDSVLKLNKDIFRQPYINDYKINVRLNKLYQKDVEYINELIIKNSEYGYIK